jgi:hypothetical protein
MVLSGGGGLPKPSIPPIPSIRTHVMHRAVEFLSDETSDGGKPWIQREHLGWRGITMVN